MRLFNRKKKISFSDFIYTKKEALPKSFCDNVIDKFEKDERKRQGQVGGGVHLDIKRSCDLSISDLVDWKSFDEAFFRSLNDFFIKRVFKFTCNFYNNSFVVFSTGNYSF